MNGDDRDKHGKNFVFKDCTMDSKVPRREITDEMVKARIRQDRAMKELAEARAQMEELERPEKERRQSEAEKIREYRKSMLRSFSEEMQALCKKYEVTVSADEFHDSLTVEIHHAMDYTVYFELNSDGSIQE